ncbi:MAG: hypothetical protein RL329_3671 [Bacteroidota bacterium]
MFKRLNSFLKEFNRLNQANTFKFKRLNNLVYLFELKCI